MGESWPGMGTSMTLMASRAGPKLGDLEAGLAGQVVADHRLLGDEGEADR